MILYHSPSRMNMLSGGRGSPNWLASDLVGVTLDLNLQLLNSCMAFVMPVRLPWLQWSKSDLLMLVDPHVQVGHF